MSRSKPKVVRLTEEEDRRYDAAARAEGKQFSEWAREAWEEKAATRMGAGFSGQTVRTVAESPGPSAQTVVVHHPRCVCRRCQPGEAA